jgi:hypothetical protein
MDSYVPNNQTPLMYSVKAFCFAHGISKTKFYELMGSGEGPTVTYIDSKPMVTAEDATTWRRVISEKGKVVGRRVPKAQDSAAA